MEIYNKTMKIKKIIGIFVFVLVALAACKKTETTETKGYLSGILSFDYPKYIEKGDSVFFCPDDKPTHPEKGSIIYTWQVTPGMERTDTTQRADHGFGYRFRADTIGSFTVTCTAIPSGDYYGTSTSNYITVIEKGFKGTLPLETTEQDSLWMHEFNNYASTRIGEHMWMRHNLAAHKDNAGAEQIGVGYLGYDIMKDVFGSYYTWEEAQKACPAGWRLPTDEEWTQMATSVKPANVSEIPAAYNTWKKVAGEMMCYYKLNQVDMIPLQAKVKITNNSRLSVKMLGYADEGKYFKMFNERAFFWTASEYDKDNKKAWCRYFVYNSPDVYAEPMEKTGFYAHVRCIKD